MAIKKSELYSAIWKSCDELRGGMEPSEYKNYILTLLFVKYVSDKYLGVSSNYAEVIVPKDASFESLKSLRGKSNIGEGINKILARLAQENDLEGIINAADFDDDAKLGSGQEKIDKLTNLINIFNDDKLNFKANRASGDDIIGDAYEYLMKNFAKESGKDKGQFYTPAEVSRIIAKIIGISGATKESQTLYDMACGSGSLLIRAADEAPIPITIYGQEKIDATGGLAKMNLVLHNKATGTIWAGKNTMSNPQTPSGGMGLAQYDFCVANPPFSDKAWMQGVTPSKDERFKYYDAYPPKKNGDYAWLLHFIYSLKPETGKGAIILPHGVLFRGNAEETLRTAIIKKHYIKGIIGLPSNLFFGTGISACIIVLDKENAEDRMGIFMIDASHGFVKDGNKNRLRECDIHKIVTTFLAQDESDPKYARMISFEEIKGNGYTLNIPRYIDSSIPEDTQDISAHLLGGIPNADIDALKKYWDVLPTLKRTLIASFNRDGYSTITVPKDEIRKAIFSNDEFMNYGKYVDEHLAKWISAVRPMMLGIKVGDKPKEFIHVISEMILSMFSEVSLIEKYDVYQALMEYWESIMQDDLYALVADGWKAGNDKDIEYKKKKDGTLTTTIKSFEGRIIPKAILIAEYFSVEQEAVDKLTAELDEVTALMGTMIEEQGDEDGLLSNVVDKGKITKDRLKKRIKEIKDDDDYTDELEQLQTYQKLTDSESSYKSALKEAQKALDEALFRKYPELTLDEIKHLVIEEKWCGTIGDAVEKIYTAISNGLAARIMGLFERYEETLPTLKDAVGTYESKVETHLKRMGFKW